MTAKTDLLDLRAELSNARDSAQTKLDRLNTERAEAHEQSGTLRSALRDLEARSTEATFAYYRLCDRTKAIVQHIDWLDSLDLDNPEDVGALARLATYLKQGTTDGP